MRGNSFQGERIGQGRENVRGFLKENRDIFGRIDSELRKEARHQGASPDVGGSLQSRTTARRRPPRPSNRSVGAAKEV